MLLKYAEFRLTKGVKSGRGGWKPAVTGLNNKVLLQKEEKLNKNQELSTSKFILYKDC